MGCFQSRRYDDVGRASAGCPKCTRARQKLRLLLPNEFPMTEDAIEYDMTPIRHLPVIFVNGVPGAGNQTVSQTLSSITGYTMIRPGELVRLEAEKDTPRGRFVTDILNAMEEVPEQLTVDLIKEEMLRNQEAKGFILVGFPRNPRMSNMFNRQVKRPEKIVALKVDNEIATERLQTKLSELGRPAAEINSARQVVKQAAHNVKSVHKRHRGHVITVNSDGHPSALSSLLKEMLKDTIEKANNASPTNAEQKSPEVLNTTPVPAKKDSKEAVLSNEPEVIELQAMSENQSSFSQIEQEVAVIVE